VAADRSSSVMGTNSRIRSVEIGGVIALAACALSLRAWGFNDTGLGQFDEGVYAFTGLGLSDPSQPHRMFPEQQKFSPPVYFSLVALSYLVRGASDHSAILVNVIVGTLSVLGIWWITRRWFGGAAALGAATFTALSEAHVILSRTALTDVTFTLLFFVALAAVVWSLERGGSWRVVVAGVMVGLAWNTKYHGWFALVIVAMAIVARGLVGRHNARERDWTVGAAKRWLVIAVVAGLCYLPWAAFIQSQPAGTGGWSSYFATMLRIDWLGNAARHAAQQAWLEGPWSRASVPLAFLAITFASPAVRRRFGNWGVTLAMLCAGALTIGAAGTSALLVLLGMPGLRRRPVSLATTMMLALLVLWVVMAPLYHPYFRLLLPFMIALHVMAAALLARWVEGADVFRLFFWRPASASADAYVAPASTAARVPRLFIGLAAVLLTVFAGRWLTDHSNPWRSARSFAAAADSIGALVPEGAPVMVLGEPALAFYLHQRGHPAFGRVTLSALDAQTEPGYLIVGRYASSAPVLRTGLAERAPRLTLLDTISIVPTDLRLLDDLVPELATRYRERPDGRYELVLYRYVPVVSSTSP
jgi:dolichyl-phosphate-mannose-protein mannosyltransferase